MRKRAARLPYAIGDKLYHLAERKLLWEVVKLVLDKERQLLVGGPAAPVPRLVR